MKIAVVGCGAVGSYYGGRLCQAENEVHFLLRNDYEVVKRQGVQVQSVQGDFKFHPRCARLPEEVGPCNLVVIGLKTTANDQLERLLPPLVDDRTAILTLQNGLGNEEALAKLYPVEQILGGLCFVCINRVSPGVIHHLGFGDIVLGEFQRPSDDRTRLIADTFQKAQIRCKLSDNLRRSRWEKLVWNIPFNGLGVGASIGYEAYQSWGQSVRERPSRCILTDELLADERWEANARGLMREVIGVANTYGLKVDPMLEGKMIDYTRSMGPYRASTLIDFEKGLPLELESVFQEPLRQAKESGFSTPLLEQLCGVLSLLDRAPRNADL